MLLALATAGIASGQGLRPRDEAGIRDQLAAYAQARQRGDGHAQALFYSEDADTWLSTTKKLSSGRPAIEQELNLPPDPNRRFRLEIESLSFVSDDVALVDTQYFGTSSEPNGHAFYVMVERDGKWLIRASRIARFAPRNSAR
jgi:uncharacterized protein (TIGR02246 family)